MLYLPDTNVFVGYLRKKQTSIRTKFQQTPPQDIVLCDIVQAELWYGAYRSNRFDENQNLIHELCAVFPSLPFDGKVSRVFGELRHHLYSSGTPIGPYDLQIAAIALHYGLILVTHNLREFQRVPGLQIEDWEPLPDPPKIFVRFTLLAITLLKHQRLLMRT